MPCHCRFGFLVIFVVELIMRDGPLDFRHSVDLHVFSTMLNVHFIVTLFSVIKSKPLCIDNIK